MTGFDYSVLAVLLFSMVFAAWRGLVREVLGFAGWITAFFAAIRFSVVVAGMLPASWSNPGVRYLVAFALILAMTLIIFALIAALLSKALRAVGLGFFDRLLGAVFGLARGAVIVIVLVLLAGMTSVPRQTWWRNSVLAPPLETAVLSLKPWLPKQIGRQLRYAGGVHLPASAARIRA